MVLEALKVVLGTSGGGLEDPHLDLGHPKVVLGPLNVVLGSHRVVWGSQRWF